MAELLQRLRRDETLLVNRTKNCPSCLVSIYRFPTGNLCQSIRSLFRFVRVCFPPALLTPECHLTSSSLVTVTRCHRPSQGTQQSTNIPSQVALALEQRHTADNCQLLQLLCPFPSGTHTVSTAEGEYLHMSSFF